jgi:hypothetical protein
MLHQGIWTRTLADQEPILLEETKTRAGARRAGSEVEFRLERAALRAAARAVERRAE